MPQVVSYEHFIGKHVKPILTNWIDQHAINHLFFGPSK